MWRAQLERVPADWRFIAPDMKGFGPSASEPATSVDEMADDVLSLLDALGIETAAFAGLSMGGYVAFAIFRAAPDRVSALVLANTRAGADSEEGRAGRDKMSALVRKDGPGAVASQMLPKLLGAASARERPGLAGEVRALVEANTTDGIDGAIQAMKTRPDSTALLSQIDRPVLVLAGAEDTLIPQADSILMATHLTRGRMVTIPQAGHLSSLEAPDAFSTAVESFLRTAL
jgi:pimeloyl-ACP methyl ester carboxylesterase